MASWHRQQWVKTGPAYIDLDGITMLQDWRCAVCGERRELFTWVTNGPRCYWHGHRKWH